MKGPFRRTLRLLTLGGGLVAVAGAALVFAAPACKPALKETWHRWKCPDVPSERSQQVTTPEGTNAWDDRGFRGSFPAHEPNLHYDFEDRSSTFFHEVDGRGVFLLEGRSPAITRRVGDVSDDPVSISAGILMKCDAPDADVRIIIRIDRPDGSLLEWNEKRLRAAEHTPGTWERFNFEWLLRDLRLPPDAQASIFLSTTEQLVIDRMDVVFRSAGPLKRPS